MKGPENEKIAQKAFIDQLNKFVALDKVKRFSTDEKDIFPCINDATSITEFDHHYTYHPAWAARIIKQNKPKKHVDISSLLSFSAILSAFVKIEFYDFRPAFLSLDNLTCGKTELTHLQFDTNSIYSISCMHTIEHIGLGRYGDRLDPEGDLKAINELKRVTAKNGDLLLVVPVGHPKICFNAHRIYSYEMIVDYLDGFALNDFSLVLDDGEFIKGANPSLVATQNYACGCFWFRKI